MTPISIQTLLSALLRTFDGVEVSHPGIDAKFELKLGIADPVRTLPGIVTELAYAAIAGKVPKKDDSCHLGGVQRLRPLVPDAARHHECRSKRGKNFQDSSATSAHFPLSRS